VTVDAVAQQRAEVMRWRKEERRRQIERRLAIDAGERQRCSGQIAAHLDRLLGAVAGRSVSVYWPFRGEPDLRPWMRDLCARGATCTLPVVVEKGKPLQFRAWHPGARLASGVWNIPFPADGAEVVPDVVIAPVVAFDDACYRLGYGGGFFDRTLAALPGTPRAIGVGYEVAAIPTIHPQPHDIPMDAVVTESGTRDRRRGPAHQVEGR
jgi:5-formyltetrahydrofolate cyclo-ligase